MTESSLTPLRADLDRVDAELVRVLARRLEIATEIGRLKAAANVAVRDTARERDVLAGAERAAHDAGVPPALVRRIFGEILHHSATRQAPAGASRTVRVAYQGVAQAYSHLAARKYVEGRGLAGEFVPCRSFRDAVDLVAGGEVDLALLPVENTTAGSVTDAYDVLRARDVPIVGEEVLRVDHCLVAVPGATVDEIRRVLSHPQALAQCAAFLASLPAVEPVAYNDTAEAVVAVAERGDPSVAAIGSAEAAAEYGLDIVATGISDQPENWTRFVVLGAGLPEYDPRLAWKTSLVLTARHERGALLRCLDVIAGSGLSMTKIESRPLPGRPWEYMFFVDVEGSVAEDAVAAAVATLKTTASFVKVLGSYPAAALPGERRPAESPPVPAVEPAPAASATQVTARRGNRGYELVDRANRAEDTVVPVGDHLVGGDGFTVIAGPCSVESYEQLAATARFVKAHGAAVLRGGVFKPRTSPYSFQGLGDEGLAILAAVGRELAMPTVTEVMAPEQVDRVADVTDMLQIGARNMQNFTLLREVGRVDRPVLLKRGLSSTIDEWLAAAEYIVEQGNSQVVLCERGIRTFENATRNTLDLSAVVVLRERTHLPVIVDPSHGTGARRYVAPLAAAARAVGAHGVMVEVHPQPDEALSDGDQSLDLAGFADTMRRIADVRGAAAQL